MDKQNYMGRSRNLIPTSLKNVVQVTSVEELNFLSFERLPFMPLKQKDGSFSFREKFSHGIFFIKERATNRIVSVQKSFSCLYHRLRTTASHSKLNGIHDLCVIDCSENIVQKVKETILKTHEDLPLFPKDFDFFRKDLLQKRKINLNKIPFSPIYKSQEQISRRTKSKTIRSCITDFGKRSGVYLFKEDGVVVYVGKSVKNLYATVYNHMLQQYDDYKKHNRARYFSKRNKHLYEVGLIEVVKRNRTQRSLAVTVGKLERALIVQCNPRDNRMHTSKESSKKIEWFDEGDFWKPPLESAPF